MMLAEIKPRSVEPVSYMSDSTYDQALIDQDLDLASWKLISNWKEHQSDRYGAGSPAPAIPRSQRQYDGDNCFDYCEVLICR